MKKIALITGGSSGIGLATTKVLSQAGYQVYEMSRKSTKIYADEKIIHLQGDVSSEEDAVCIVKKIIDKEGQIDLLINNAGFGISGAAEYTKLEDAKNQFDVNFFGVVNMTKAVLPYMRLQEHGRIINLSSLAAVIPLPFQSFYSASKAAMNNYTLALRNELKPYGVTVCALMPGDICTNFTDVRRKDIIGDKEYGGRISKSIERMEQDERNGKDPTFVANKLLLLAQKRYVKPLYSLGFNYRFFYFLIRILPTRLINNIVYKLYAKQEKKSEEYNI